MRSELLTAMEISKSAPSASCQEVFAAEETIGRMSSEERAQFESEIPRNPHDAWLRLWCGLAWLEQGAGQRAAQEFAEAVQRGCRHWRMGWYIAKAARLQNDLELVD